MEDFGRPGALGMEMRFTVVSRSCGPGHCLEQSHAGSPCYGWGALSQTPGPDPGKNCDIFKLCFPILKVPLGDQDTHRPVCGKRTDVEGWAGGAAGTGLVGKGRGVEETPETRSHGARLPLLQGP